MNALFNNNREKIDEAARPQAPRPKPPDLVNKTCAQFFKLGVLGGPLYEEEALR